MLPGILRKPQIVKIAKSKKQKNEVKTQARKKRPELIRCQKQLLDYFQKNHILYSESKNYQTESLYYDTPFGKIRVSWHSTKSTKKLRFNFVVTQMSIEQILNNISEIYSQVLIRQNNHLLIQNQLNDKTIYFIKDPNNGIISFPNMENYTESFTEGVNYLNEVNKYNMG